MIGLIALAAVAFASNPLPTENVPVAGILRFHGEYSIALDVQGKSDFGKNCVNVAFSKDISRRKIKALIGKQITAQGNLVAWGPDLMGLSINGYFLKNFCDGKNVLILKSLRHN